MEKFLVNANTNKRLYSEAFDDDYEMCKLKMEDTLKRYYLKI